MFLKGQSGGKKHFQLSPLFPSCKSKSLSRVHKDTKTLERVSRDGGKKEEGRHRKQYRKHRWSRKTSLLQSYKCPIVRKDKPLIGNNRSNHLFCKCWEAALKWGCLRAKEAPVMLLAIHILPGTEPSLAFTVFYLQKCYLASFSEILLDI